jgi:hypothetical protein
MNPIPPPISLDYLGYKFVVAGNKVVYQPKEQAQFFTENLFSFVQNTWFLMGLVNKMLGLMIGMRQYFNLQTVPPQETKPSES